MLCACAKKSPIVAPTITRPRASSIPTVSFSLSIYQNLIRDARVGSHSLQRRTTFPVRAHTSCGEDYRRGLIQSFFVLFSFSARRQNSRVPKIFFEKKMVSFFRETTLREQASAGDPPLKEKSGARVVKRQRERENRIE